ncbi:MAG: hypothetical protein E6J66_17185 [Deltaproteobacteria bacterium]|nr:MAG: hypothetical protein E6J66_17185 [Deltaproteobacteria bacterium]
MRRLHWILGPAFAAVLATMPVANVKAQEKVIQVTAERFKFTPSVIELKLGEPVILELTTLDRKHGFQVSDLNIDETVEPRKVTHIRIVPARSRRDRRGGSNDEDQSQALEGRPFALQRILAFGGSGERCPRELNSDE